MRIPGRLGLVALLVFLCGSPVPLRAADTAPAAGHSLSAEDADLLVGLIADVMLHPERNAISTSAKAFHWKPLTPDLAAAGNAKVGYTVRYRGKVILVGGDGTNDILSVGLGDAFNESEVRAHFQGVALLKKLASDDQMGSRTDVYRLTDQGKAIGVLVLTYGIAPATRGAGSAGFMSAARAARENIPH